MRRNRLARPDGADFRRRGIADREDKLHLRRAVLRELIPTLAAQPCNGQPRGFELFQCVWMDTAGRMASRAECVKIRSPTVIQDRFAQDRPRRIASAKK